MDKRPHLTGNARKLLENRYLMKDENGKVKETPRQLFERVAKAVSWAEKSYADNYKYWYDRILNSLLNLEIMPASPYLFNCRDPEVEKSHGLFSCFVIPIEDSMDKIYDCMKEAALVYQKAGGVGIDFSPLREKGALVKTSNGVSSGPLAFLQTFDNSAATISQAGVRRSASMAALNIDHPDIEEFINIKSQNLPEINRLMKIILTSNDKTLKAFAQKELDRLQNLTKFNLSVKITDDFMNAVRENLDWNLKSVISGEIVKTIKARKLFRTICEYAWKSGDPGVLFIDTINKDNACPHLGRVECVNPCVTGDTLILTRDGYSEIKNNVDKDVDIWNGEEWSCVRPFYTGKKNIFKVELTNGQELTCSNNHEFIIVEGRKEVRRNVENLKVGDKLAKFELPIVENGVDPKIDAYSHGFYCGDGNKNSASSLVYWTKYCVTHRLIGTIGEEREDRRAKPWYHGKMLDKDSVPIGATKQYVIEWFTGLLDADGTVQHNPNSDGLQICSINRKFLTDVQLMLTRIGVRATVDEGRKEKLMKDPNCNYGYYKSNICYRLCINCSDTQRLMHNSLNCSRLKIRKVKVQRDARRFVKVKSIKNLNRIEDVYCFTDNKAHRGTFNGIITGQCGEQDLHPYGSCNLSAVNLNKCIKNGSFNYDKLTELVETAVRICENAIDISSYPIPQIEEMAKKTRNVGVGVMGVADALIKIGVPYGSKEAQEFLSNVSKLMRSVAIKTSEQLAKERGTFPAYEGSKWDKGTTMEGKRIVLRNARLLTAQPTGSVAIISGASHGIEPIFSVFYQRRLQDGTIYTELNKEFKEIVESHGINIDDVVSELKKCGTIQKINFLPQEVKDIFKCAMDISPEEHIYMQAAFQKYNDSSTSKTINLPFDATVQDVEEAYKLAYSLNCKGITVFRDGCKTGVLNIKSEQDSGTEELRNFLFEKFVRESLTAKEIADMLDVSESQVFAKLKRFGIKKDEKNTTIQARKRKLTTTLKEIIFANLLVGNSKINTVENQSSYRQVSDHCVYVKNIRKKFLDNGINCSEIMVIVTDKTYYYFDTVFNTDIYNLKADNDKIGKLNKDEVETLVTRNFMRNLFLVDGIKTGKGGVQFCSKHGNYKNLKKIMEVFEKEIDAKFKYREKKEDNGIVYIPKSYIEQFYGYIESGENIGRINSIQSKASCPECGGILNFCEGCRTCPSCGFSACSI